MKSRKANALLMNKELVASFKGASNNAKTHPVTITTISIISTITTSSFAK